MRCLNCRRRGGNPWCWWCQTFRGWIFILPGGWYWPAGGLFRDFA